MDFGRDGLYCADTIRPQRQGRERREGMSKGNRPGGVSPTGDQGRHQGIRGERVTEHIYLCPDGVYRWVYEFPMLKNPTILISLIKIFGGIILGMMVFSFLLSVIEGNGLKWIRGFLLTPQFLILPGIMLGLTLTGYIVLACIYGFRYMVLFEMDESRILHIQMDKQFRKAQALGWLTGLAGLGAGSVGTVGIGISAASRNRMETEFARVKRVAGKRGLHTIHLVQTLGHNQIYVRREDYDFVWNYITSRCNGARIKG